MCSLRASCSSLSPEKRALLSWLRSRGVSDQAFISALAIVQMLAFNRHRALHSRPISAVTGLPVEIIRPAIDELVQVGALEAWSHQHKVRRVYLYRLVMPPDACEP